MIFSSPMFLTVFLPAALGLYYLAPRRLKNAVLFALSLIFYGWGEPVYVALMVLTTLVNWALGLLEDRCRGTGRAKACLIASLVFDLALLGVFKYSAFAVTTLNALCGLALPVPALRLPIGISFYTFQIMSYTIDVWRGRAAVQRDFIAFGAYVALFPQLIAGPIVRYTDVAEQLTRRTHSAERFGAGASRFVCGLSKKVLLANTLGEVWAYFSAASSLSALGAWLGAACYAFQIYYDFSGYSDMALGLGLMLGFTFPENFDHPYTARSVTEFWRRWHISLGAWFREYVYIPLGGNRRGLRRQLFNMLVVWLLTGVWHGAGWTFLLWGLYYFALLALEKLFLLKYLQRGRVWPHLYTLTAVCFGWVLFACDTPAAALRYASRMVGVGAAAYDGAAVYYLVTLAPLLLAAALGSTALPKRLWARFGSIPLAPAGAMLAGLLASLAFLVAGTYNPFLYFRF